MCNIVRMYCTNSNTAVLIYTDGGPDSTWVSINQSEWPIILVASTNQNSPIGDLVLFYINQPAGVAHKFESVRH